MDTIGRWDVFELALSGRADGNPFTDYTIRGVFNGPERVTVDGFYDGEGVYRVGSCRRSRASMRMR